MNTKTIKKKKPPAITAAEFLKAGGEHVTKDDARFWCNAYKALADVQIVSAQGTDFVWKEPEEKYVWNDDLGINEPIMTEPVMGKRISITTGTGTYAFNVLDGEVYHIFCRLLGIEYTLVEKPVIKRMFTFPDEVLASIKKAQKFCTTDDLRPAMTAVCLEIEDNFLRIVSTDAHRLFMSPAYEVSGPPGKFVYLLPARALTRLPKVLKEKFFPFYEIKEGKASFLGTTCELVDAKFPDYKCVVPEYNTSITFRKKDFISCVKQVLPFCNKSTYQVAIDMNGSMIFKSQDVDFSFEGDIRMAYVKKTMPDAILAFNGKFLIDTMNALETGEFDEITMMSGGVATKAAIFTNGTDRALLMPIML